MRNLILLPLLLIIISCSTIGVKRYNLKEADNKKIISIINKKREILNYKGSFNIIYTDTKGKNRTSGSLYFDNLERLILVANGVVGETELLMYGDGDSLYLENYFEDYYYKESYSDKLLSNLISYPLSFKEVRSVLSGFRFSNENISVVDKDSTHIKFYNKKLSKEYIFDNKLKLESIRDMDKGSLARELKIDYYYRESDFIIPRRLIFRDYVNKKKLTIFFNRISLNNNEFKKPTLKKF
ncbi:MAG: hypothetical protein CR982_03815 [Candidatus Cloacimonadota bacterium]|nr:MAG: hypothetical protein CR982_03815 [Candidatus Cloacimonadota bacterium]PIE78011.1 MAG: hypothetical protein CSA15_09950 [Candidatus Delongbacteria bacterium]